jgi:hypothetical protein
MRAVWLRPNYRALMLGMVPPALAVLMGVVAVAAISHPLAMVMGGVLTAGGAVLLMLLAWQMRSPRLAQEGDFLLVYLRGGQPIRVPLEIVECFLLGQAPAMLPGKKNELTEAASTVIRLNETAEEWKHRDVKPALGKWCEGYITLRGTWCEPLSVQAVYRLNALLAEAKQAKVAS